MVSPPPSARRRRRETPGVGPAFRKRTERMSLMTWVIAVGGPLLGIAAVVALVVAHEHGAALRRAKLPMVDRVPRAPHAGRRAASTLLEEYLAEERQASAAERRQRHAGLLLQTSRSSTWVLEEYLEDRATAGAAAVHPLPMRRLPTQEAPVRAAPARVQPRRVEERAARPTRLVPLTAQAEIAIG